jgi:hypothetical protein
MHAPLAALVLFFGPGATLHRRAVTLFMPHALRAGETTSLLGVDTIQHDAEIEITTASGLLAGVISPYGIRPGHEAGMSTIPFPAEAISRQRVSLLSLLTANGKQRAPTMKEVTRVRASIFLALARVCAAGGEAKRDRTVDSQCDCVLTAVSATAGGNPRSLRSDSR